MSADSTPFHHGPRFERGGVTFRVWAPRSRALTLVLDGLPLPMQRRPNGGFELRVEAARPDARYAFRLEDGLVRPDPASRRQPEGVHAASQLFDPGTFGWTDAQWRGLPLERLAFYELHVGTFTPEGTLDAAADQLEALKSLGITCVELMPVQPFPGTRNWGYDGVQPYGVQESYGGPAALQRFVDRAHGLGLAVCLDVVYNHMGPEGNYLRDFGPYFTSRHRSPWGDGINFDGDDAGPVRDFAVGAAVQWVRDFHVDVLRLDAVHAIPDDSPKHLVAALTEAVAEVARETGRQVQVVAESDLNDRKVVEPAPAGWGCAASWADDYHHALHTWLTAERAHFYADYGAKDDLVRALAEGFVYQGQASAFRGRAHGTPTAGLRPAQFVFCAQNHDQVGNRPLGERLAALVPFEALFPVAALTVLGPGLPHLFMGEEHGETNPFLYFTSHSDPALAQAVSEGRKAEFIAAGGAGEAPDPQAESTFERSRPSFRADGRHGALRETYRRLLALRAKHHEALGESWPTVRREGPVVTLRRPFLTLAVNLSPQTSGGLPAWGWSVEEQS